MRGSRVVGVVEDEVAVPGTGDVALSGEDAHDAFDGLAADEDDRGEFAHGTQAGVSPLR